MFESADPLQEQSPQDELWLISYADLLTLLIGFFVLIIASVPLRRASFERIAAALSGSQRATPLEELREKVDRMVERSPELRERVLTRDDAEGLGIEFKDALLFDSGSAALRAQAQPAIAEIARPLRELPGRPATVEGHADHVPISTRELHTDRERSAQRALDGLGGSWSTPMFAFGARPAGMVRAPGPPTPGAGSPAICSSSICARTESRTHCSGQSVRSRSTSSARARSSASRCIFSPASGAAATRNAMTMCIVHSTRMTTRRLAVRCCSREPGAESGRVSARARAFIRSRATPCACSAPSTLMARCEESSQFEWNSLVLIGTSSVWPSIVTGRPGSSRKRRAISAIAGCACARSAAEPESKSSASLNSIP